jgi:hypothetical protein
LHAANEAEMGQVGGNEDAVISAKNPMSAAFDGLPPSSGNDHALGCHSY